MYQWENFHSGADEYAIWKYQELDVGLPTNGSFEGFLRSKELWGILGGIFILGRIFLEKVGFSLFGIFTLKKRKNPSLGSINSATYKLGKTMGHLIFTQFFWDGHSLPNKGNGNPKNFALSRMDLRNERKSVFALANILFWRERKRFNVWRMDFHYGFEVGIRCAVFQNGETFAKSYWVHGIMKKNDEFLFALAPHPVKMMDAVCEKGVEWNEERKMYWLRVSEMGKVMIIKSVEARHYFRKERYFWGTGSRSSRIW